MIKPLLSMPASNLPGPKERRAIILLCLTKALSTDIVSADIRAAVVEAAHTACRVHPHWKAQLARLEPRLGKNKAIVAIARKLLVAVWHVLNERCADRFAQPEMVARKLARYAHTLGREKRPDGQSVGQFVRQQLDRLDIGAGLDAIQWGKRTIPMPPSHLAADD